VLPGGCWETQLRDRFYCEQCEGCGLAGGGGAGERADSALCCVTIRAIVTKLHCESIETKRVTRAISCKSEKRDRVRKRKK
jgi:hypothetical protein